MKILYLLNRVRIYLINVGAVIKDAIFEKLGTLRLYKVWHIENNGYCLNKENMHFYSMCG